MIPFVIGTYINADDVALADHPGTGDAVDHFVIDRNTGASRESAVAKKGRLCALRENELVDLAVDFRGGNTGLAASPPTSRACAEILPASRIAVSSAAVLSTTMITPPGSRGAAR